MFRTATGQTGMDAYRFELAACANAQRALDERLKRLAATIAEELPPDAAASMSIASERYPDARLPVDRAGITRQLEFVYGCDTFNLNAMRELLDSIE